MALCIFLRVTQIQSAFFIGFHCFTPPQYRFPLGGKQDFLAFTHFRVLQLYIITLFCACQ
nr:MAG TPA: hypothetical protein [Caudoviricetes sp.]